MKAIKVNYMGKRLKDIYPYATKWQVFKYRVRRLLIKLAWVVALAVIVVGIFEAGSYLNPATIYTKAEVIKEVPIKAPIMEKIAKCESPTGHYGKNGQVVVRGNDNHTVDIGSRQINSYYWGAKATELGYNLWIEKDNIAMGDWIYQNYGTEPWSSSKKCWQK